MSISSSCILACAATSSFLLLSNSNVALSVAGAFLGGFCFSLGLVSLGFKLEDGLAIEMGWVGAAIIVAGRPSVLIVVVLN